MGERFPAFRRKSQRRSTRHTPCAVDEPAKSSGTEQLGTRRVPHTTRNSRRRFYGDGRRLYRIHGVCYGDVSPLLLCSSIPLGSPPVQDPNLGRIAPKQCVFYVGWAGMGTPDAKSHNSAERFLADPEIRHMRAEAARRFRLLMKAAPASANDASSTFTIGPCNIPPQFSADAEFWCELLVTRPCAGFISHLTQGDNSPDPHGGFVMNVGDARLRVAAMLKPYRGLAKDIIEERTVDGATEYRLKTTSPPAHDDSRDSNGQAAQGPRAGQDLFLVSDGNKPRSASAPTTAAAKNLKPTTNAASKPATAEPAGLPIRWSLRGKYLIITCGDDRRRRPPNG